MARPQTTCTIDGCGQLHEARGYCSSHYEKLVRRAGSCSRSRCRRRTHRAGLCQKHYREQLGTSRIRGYAYRAKYGITFDQYEELLEAQGGVCAICRKPCHSGRELAVDHDHETGQVRGLLCISCNSAVGLLKDNPECFNAAAEYLRRDRG